MGRLCGRFTGFAVLCCACASAQTVEKQIPVLTIEQASQIRPLALAADAEISAKADSKSELLTRSGKTQPKSGARSGLNRPSGSRKPRTEFRKSDGTDPVNGKAIRPKERQPLKRRVIVVKAKWCGACQLLNHEWPKLRAVRWRIGASDTQHFQLIDVDTDPGVVARYGITQLPTLLLIENGKILDRTGGLDAADLAEFYYGRL